MESPDLPWAGKWGHRLKKRPEEPPSLSAVFFLDYLSRRGIRSGRMVDIGCGNGRNAIYFAKNGFEVHAVDRSDEVLKDLDLHGVMPHCHSVTDSWLFEDGFFDLAMDVLCFSGQPESGHREIYLSELKRVLKPGGLLLLSVPSADYRKEKTEKEFPGFRMIESQGGEDVQNGKKLKTMDLILAMD
ncbi:MAG: class I SAM-dependent methyltransferase [Candidatus Micrarchaeota archaeon]